MGVRGGGPFGALARRTATWAGAAALVLTTAVSGYAVHPAGAEASPGPAVASPTDGATATDGVTATGDTVGPPGLDDEQVDAPLPTTSSVGALSSRLAGAERYSSAVAISQWAYPSASGASVVYLARGDEFADALTAGSLSDGPVLLTRGGCGDVPGSVLAEIRRIDPDQVVALGGPGAVCDVALQTAAQGRETARVGGTTRAETAALIARRAFPDGASRVYLTRGAITPDAVVGGSLSDGPVLLTSGDGRTIPSATASAISALGPGSVVALGGPGAVSDDALRAAAAGRATGRLAGANRYETATAIARYAYPDRTGRVYVARGDGSNFVDAVASGMLDDGPVLLNQGGDCSPVVGATNRFLAERNPGRVIALGGPGALCESTLRGAALDARPAVDCARTACVALTYDDGPGPRTQEVSDIFARERVPGTFYVVGKKLAERGDLTRNMWIEGHEIGNHSFDHVRMPDLTLAQQRDQVDRTDAALATWGVPRTTQLRPPFLAFNADSRQLGKAVVMVDTNPKDWDGPSAEEIRRRIRENVRPGSIVIQHDTVGNTVTALPGILTDLKAAGYTIVTVSELIPDLRPGDLVYNRSTIYPLGTLVDPAAPVSLDDGRVLPPMEGGTGALE